MANDVITLIKTHYGLQPSQETISYFSMLKSKLKDGQKVSFKKISNKKARVLKHHKRYHAIILPTIANNMSSIDMFIHVNENGINLDGLHRYLLLRFAYDTGRPELIKMYPTFDIETNNYREMPYVSESFEKMSQKTFEEYEKWLDTIYTKEVGVSLIKQITEEA